MLDLIKAYETESELDFLQESFVLTDEKKEAIFRQRIVFWIKAMADDIEQGNDFDDLTATWTEERRSRFIADWNNNKGFLDIDSQAQEGHGAKRPHENEPETSNKRQKDDHYFTITSAKQAKVRKFSTTGTNLYVLLLG